MTDSGLPLDRARLGDGAPYLQYKRFLRRFARRILNIGFVSSKSRHLTVDFVFVSIAAEAAGPRGIRRHF